MQRRCVLSPKCGRLAWVLVGLSLELGCAHLPHAPRAAQSMTAGDDEDDASGTASVMAMQPEATPTEATTAEDKAQAAQALARGLAAYHRGDYGAAEAALKEAMTQHPFLAPAHLTLGKIYLLRGIAADDHKRLQKGRRMVEMAQRLDPTLVEAQAILQLFP